MIAHDFAYTCNHAMVEIRYTVLNALQILRQYIESTVTASEIAAVWYQVIANIRPIINKLYLTALRSCRGLSPDIIFFQLQHAKQRYLNLIDRNVYPKVCLRLLLLLRSVLVVIMELYLVTNRALLDSKRRHAPHSHKCRRPTVDMVVLRLTQSFYSCLFCSPVPSTAEGLTTPLFHAGRVMSHSWHDEAHHVNRFNAQVCEVLYVLLHRIFSGLPE